jgi:hypothetical protein
MNLPTGDKRREWRLLLITRKVNFCSESTARKQILDQFLPLFTRLIPIHHRLLARSQDGSTKIGNRQTQLKARCH